jgi:hypothetical protein
MKHVIPVVDLDLKGTCHLLKQLEVPVGCSEVEFDFAKLGTVEPFGLLVASRAIHMFRADHRAIRFHGVNFENRSNCNYAAHLGFFQNFGMKFGRTPGDAQGNQNHIPIQTQAIDELLEESKDAGERIEEILAIQAGQMASVLARAKSGPLYVVLAYCIREILRNVVDHSRAKSYEYCPTKNRVEVAILDRGVGVRIGLSNHPDLKNLGSDRDALNWAILPGISGRTFRGVFIDQNDPYQNSGFGLFVTSQLCKDHGSFMIGSYGSLMKLKGADANYFDFGLRGTAVRLVLDTENLPADIEAEVGEIVRQGEEIADKLPSAVKVPNSASKLLRGAFSSGTFGNG